MSIILVDREQVVLFDITVVVGSITILTFRFIVASENWTNRSSNDFSFKWMSLLKEMIWNVKSTMSVFSTYLDIIYSDMSRFRCLLWFIERIIPQKWCNYRFGWCAKLLTNRSREPIIFFQPHFVYDTISHTSSYIQKIVWLSFVSAEITKC